TLAGARRKLQEEATPVAADAPELDELMGEHARERLTEVKRGLRAILELLAGRTTKQEFQLRPPTSPASARRLAAPARRPGAPAARAKAPVKSAAPPPRRKR
ncbi:MAG: hypothetical protein AB7J35_22240, partial [Dehalococcoidia bacterium]